MSESKRAHHRSTGGPDGQPISRRTFVRDLSALSVTALAIPSLCSTAGGYGKPPYGRSPQPEAPTVAPPALPQAEATPVTATPGPAALSVWEALKNRQSATAFQPQPLSEEMLLNLLWAAFGVNRPDSGKRTAPSAMNAQDIDIYVLLAGGAYVYDAKGNELTSVSAQDLRAQAVPRGFMKEAPVHLVYVSDYAKMNRVAQPQKEIFAACHTGFIGQNVYLYCAAEGLGARFHASPDRNALKDSLKLREDQAVVFAQAVGYPKG